MNSPYTFTWNSVQPGTYVLSALAIDAAGAVATSAPVNITVYYNHAQTTNYTWTGAASGDASDWLNPTNWNPNGVPGVLDNATLANNGTINLVNNVSINNFTLSSGTLGGTATLTVTNAAAWSGGTINGSLVMATNSALTISGSVTLNGLLVNNGNVSWSNGNINGNPTCTFTNNGLLLHSANNGTFYNGLFVNNGIVRAAAPASGMYFNNPTFVNNGTVDAESGSISFDSGGVLAGTYNFAAAGGIYFSGGTFALGALPVLTGSGVLEFNGGTLDVAITVPPALQLVGGTVVPGPVFQDAGTITNLTIAGSTLSGASNTLSGTLNWTAGTINGQLTVEPTGVLNISSGNNKTVSSLTLINLGQVIWTGGTLSGDAHSLFTNNGAWLNEGDLQMNFGQGSSTFVNNGLFQKTNSTGTTTFYNLIFVNNGTVDAESGAIALEYGGTPSGTYNAAAGAAVDFASGTFTLGSFPTITGSGAVQLTGGTMNVASDIPPGLRFSGGTFTLGPSFQNGGAINNLTNSGATLSGAYTVTGTLTWLAGYANGSLTIASNATLDIAGSAMHLGNCAFTNNGTVNWTSGTVNGNSATIAVNNGLWLASANNYFQNGDCCGVFTVTNNGIFRNTANTTEFAGVAFNNYGLVDVEGGSVNFNYGGLLGGTYNVAQYFSLYFTGGSFSAGTPPVITGAGLCEFTGGTLTLLVDQISNLSAGGRKPGLGGEFSKQRHHHQSDHFGLHLDRQQQCERHAELGGGRPERKLAGGGNQRPAQSDDRQHQESRRLRSAQQWHRHLDRRHAARQQRHLYHQQRPLAHSDRQHHQQQQRRRPADFRQQRHADQVGHVRDNDSQ